MGKEKKDYKNAFCVPHTQGSANANISLQSDEKSKRPPKEQSPPPQVPRKE
jgi:hypothetical protein